MQLSVYFQSSTGEPEGLFAGWKVARITPSRMHDGSALPRSRHTLARPCCLVTEASRIHPCGRQKINFGKMAGELHHFQNLRYVAISDNSNASSRFGRRLVGLAIKCSKAILRVRHGYGASQNVPLKNTGILKSELCCPQEANRTRSAVDITAAEMVAREHGDSAANKCVA